MEHQHDDDDGNELPNSDTFEETGSALQPRPLPFTKANNALPLPMNPILASLSAEEEALLSPILPYIRVIKSYKMAGADARGKCFGHSILIPQLANVQTMARSLPRFPSDIQWIRVTSNKGRTGGNYRSPNQKAYTRPINLPRFQQALHFLLNDTHFVKALKAYGWSEDVNQDALREIEQTGTVTVQVAREVSVHDNDDYNEATPHEHQNTTQGTTASAHHHDSQNENDIAETVLRDTVSAAQTERPGQGADDEPLDDDNTFDAEPEERPWCVQLNSKAQKDILEFACLNGQQEHDNGEDEDLHRNMDVDETAEGPRGAAYTQDLLERMTTEEPEAPSRITPLDGAPGTQSRPAAELHIPCLDYDTLESDTQPYLFTLAFPSLQIGALDYNIDGLAGRYGSLGTRRSWMRHVFSYVNGRFIQHPLFTFYVLNWVFVPPPSLFLFHALDDVRASLISNGKHSLFSDLQTATEQIAGTAPYWARVRRDLIQFINWAAFHAPQPDQIQNPPFNLNKHREPKDIEYAYEELKTSGVCTEKNMCMALRYLAQLDSDSNNQTRQTQRILPSSNASSSREQLMRVLYDTANELAETTPEIVFDTICCWDSTPPHVQKSVAILAREKSKDMQQTTNDRLLFAFADAILSFSNDRVKHLEQVGLSPDFLSTSLTVSELATALGIVQTPPTDAAGSESYPVPQSQTMGKISGLKICKLFGFEPAILERKLASHFNNKKDDDPQAFFEVTEEETTTDYIVRQFERHAITSALRFSKDRVRDSSAGLSVIFLTLSFAEHHWSDYWGPDAYFATAAADIASARAEQYGMSVEDCIQEKVEPFFHHYPHINSTTDKKRQAARSFFLSAFPNISTRYFEQRVAACFKFLVQPLTNASHYFARNEFADGRGQVTCHNGVHQG
mmetsp:Transcript_36428/g.91647  ORF Transcript_36428/g.91647 Transcript_36428/m.91647 type:complete len:906 (+) Transcript_36428:480-3197(+)